MITADGWFDWAIRKPGPANKVNRDTNGNPRPNPARAVFLHSAEGYKAHLLDLAVNGPLSWHASNMIDGEFYQHYPLNQQTWHATTANVFAVGIENEGVVGNEPTLSQPQVNNAVRAIADLAAWRGWTPRRPSSPTDIQMTLWEHNEVVRIGGSGTACPSGRIPWDVILADLNPTPVPPEPARRFIAGDAGGGIEVAGNQIIVWNNGVSVLAIGDYEGAAPGQLAKLRGIEWRWLRDLALPGSDGPATWSTVKGD